MKTFLEILGGIFGLIVLAGGALALWWAWVVRSSPNGNPFL